MRQSHRGQNFCELVSDSHALFLLANEGNDDLANVRHKSYPGGEIGVYGHIPVRAYEKRGQTLG